MARTGLIVGGEVSNPSLRSALTYDQRIAADAALLCWYVPDASRVTLDTGRIAAITDRSAAAKNITQATSGRRPLYEATGGPNSRPSMYFEAARTDILVSTAVFPTGSTASFTKVVLYKSPAESNTSQFRLLMGGGANATGMHWLAVRGSNSLRNVISSTSGVASVAHTPDTWTMVMASWDPSAQVIAISVNGATPGTTTTSGRTVTDANLALGCTAGPATQPLTGSIADAMVWNVDLFASANAAKLAAVKQYFRDRYDMTIS